MFYTDRWLNSPKWLQNRHKRRQRNTFEVGKLYLKLHSHLYLFLRSVTFLYNSLYTQAVPYTTYSDGRILSLWSYLRMVRHLSRSQTSPSHCESGKSAREEGKAKGEETAFRLSSSSFPWSLAFSSPVSRASSSPACD